MNAVNEQRELANEIAEALSNPIYGVEVDEVSFLSCRLAIPYFTDGPFTPITINPYRTS